MPQARVAPAAVYFLGDGYSTRGVKLMGRQSAGAGFLRALAASGADEQMHALLGAPDQGPGARAAFLEAGHAGGLELLGPGDWARLGESGCLYLPMPSLSEPAWRRAAVGERRFSLCGVTHTIATHSVMSAVADLLSAPVRAWDALVCTSHAGRDAVNEVLQAQADYLKWRLGATRFELPQLPVIPLGVHVDDFRFGADERAAARARLGIAPADRVVLFAGRLSFHAKAHPHPMLVALQRCAQARPDLRIHLIQCGKFFNDAIAQAFDEAGRVLAPSVCHHPVDGLDAAAWRDAWAAADIFTSLSDNIQETFGLTPIEAMAAGLPAVVSDWDGYKDTVRDGVDGLRVPTTSLPPGQGADLAARYEAGLDSYDIYCGQLCELVAVDVDAATAAYGRLIDDEALCRRMGASGRARAREVYDWPVVMAAYRRLWAQLADLRRHAPDLHGALPLRQAPDRMDPLRMFAGYPTHLLCDEDRLSLTAPLDAAEYERVRNLACHRFAQRVLPTHAQAAPLWQRWAGEPVLTVGALLAGLPESQAALLRRGLVWYMKTGWVRRA